MSVKPTKRGAELSPQKAVTEGEMSPQAKTRPEGELPPQGSCPIRGLAAAQPLTEGFPAAADILPPQKPAPEKKRFTPFRASFFY